MATTRAARPLAPGVALGPGPAHLVPAVGLRAGDVAREVAADQAREGARLGDQRLDVEDAVGIVGERHVRRALLPDRAGQAPGVDAADADPAAPGQPRRQRLGRAPVRRLGRVPLHHQAGGDGVCRLVVLGLDADVADMGEGEGHDLPGIGRIGHDLLIAGHRGVEAEFGRHRSLGAEAVAVEEGSVGQREAGGGRLGGVRWHGTTLPGVGRREH